MALGIGQISLQGTSWRYVDAVVLVAHHHHESFVAIAHTIFITHILGKTEGVVVLDMVDHDDDRLHAQLVVQTLQRDVHVVNGLLGQYVIGIGDILCGILQEGDGDVLSIPEGSLLRGADSL